MNFLKVIYIFLRTYFTKLQLIAILGIALYAFVISENNIFARIEYDVAINSLNNKIEHYRKQAAGDLKKFQELDADKDEIEKFARENYLMKKSNEDIFIVE